MTSAGSQPAPENADLSLKTMKLYTHVDRIYKELNELGLAEGCSLRVEDVSKLDQYHYHGTEVVTQVATQLDIKASDRILDIGCGIGGVSRYLAHLTGCHVTAVELQPDLHKVGEDLTRRCRLDHLVNHVCANVLEMPPGALGTYDVITSFLVFLHIKDKEKLFSFCRSVLRPGGKMYIEDMTRMGEFSEREEILLHQAVAMPLVPPTSDDYSRQLIQAGFSVLQYVDVTEDWTKFCSNRAARYRSEEARHTRVHGSDVYNEQMSFFAAIDQLFTGGHLGGCQITVMK